MIIHYFEKHITPKSCILLVFFLLVRLTALCQLKADFTALVTEGCTPLFVQFVDMSSGNPNQWFWDLGDGTTSTRSSPGIIYINPGSYTVKLRVKNANGEDSVTKTAYINVYAKPNVDFSATPNSGCFPLLVDFADNSDPVSGTSKSWLWDFGDGITSTEQNPTHLYEITDTFAVILKVTNSFGCSQSVQKKSFISVADTVLADFNTIYDNACKFPVTINFSNQSQSSIPLAYRWSFGDGTTETVSSPSHTYFNAGIYDVTLISSNSNGCSDTIIKLISIGVPITDFSVPAIGCVGQPVTLKDSSAPPALSGAWNFGDGTTANGLDLTHTYNKPGIYTVTYTANFGGCSNTVKKNIQVADFPVTSFISPSVLSKCEGPLTVQFTNTSSGGDSFLWDFGDGTTSTDVNPVHIYAGTGYFTVTLTAFTSGGSCNNVVSLPGFVKIGAPRINGFVNMPHLGCVGESIIFEASIDSPEPVTTYLWDFGDGNTSGAASPVHSYAQPGTYDVFLMITTGSGCTDSLKFPHAVTVSTPPVVNFQAQPLNACASDEVHFTDLTPGVNTGWRWEFGDGTISDQQNPTHHFIDTGYFSITLRVDHNGCWDSLVLTRYVYVKAPIASYQTVIDCSQRMLRTFRDLSVGALKWNWDFGDGNTDTIASPSHIYADTGNYNVRLIVTNESCADTLLTSVNIIDENPDFTIESIDYCKYDSIKFSARNYTLGNINGFKWNFGDGSGNGTYKIRDTVVYHRYSAAGVYNPALYIIDNNGCRDTMILSHTTTIYGPVAAFSNIEGMCKGSNFIFNDESKSDGTHAIANWFWDYGDGQTGTLTSGPFTHLYLDSGTYDVKLIVTDTKGCTDTSYKQGGVIISQPVAGFSLIDSIKCTQNTVMIKNNSVGINLQYKWDFGDGGTSDTSNPAHAYLKEGQYTIKLGIADRFGCRDSITKENIVTISNPVASFAISDSAASCPPLEVITKNYSQNYQNVLWDFGDGNTSSLFEPSKLYLLPGNYNMQLIAHGYGNCYDTVSKLITIEGPTGAISYDAAHACFPAEITFYAVTQNTASYIWDFGDGTTQAGVSGQTTYTYTEPGVYLPKLILTDYAGCQVAFVNPDSIKISGIKPELIYAADVGCDSSLVIFTDSSIVSSFDLEKSRTVNFGDGYSSAEVNPVHYYKKSGTYNVTLFAETTLGCTGTYSLPVTVEVKSSPFIVSAIPDSACLNSSVNFSAYDTTNSQNSLKWLWQFGNNDYSEEQNPLYAYAATGKYIVTVILSSSNGCSDTDKGELAIMPLPDIDAGPESSICLNNSMTLQPGGGETYVWDASGSLSCTQCKNPVANPLINTTYYVTGSDGLGCMQRDSIEIKVIQPTVINVAVKSDTVCTGGSILLGASGAEKYQWSPSSGLSNANIPNPVATPQTTTTYTVIGSDSKNCFSDTGEVSVLVAPVPVFNIADSLVTMGVGSTYIIKTTNSPDIVSWIWQPAFNLSCTNCAQPTALLKTNVTYSAEALNIFGCVAADNIRFEVICNNSNVFIPNTFSPNNDSRNDYFFPQGKGLFTIKSMKIFNRWGAMVYSKVNFAANMASQGWDGKYASQDQPSGVYVYIIEVLCDNGTVLNYKGDITLLR